MDAKKRKRLEAGGWRTGTVRELLDLTPAEEAYIEIRLALSDHLRMLRKSLRWTQAQVAHRVRSSQSRVAKMESGDPEISLDLLVTTLLELGATRKELGRIVGRRAA
jgi:DNA-binding XRE family transcriptional regulator